MDWAAMTVGDRVRVLSYGFGHDDRERAALSGRRGTVTTYEAPSAGAPHGRVAVQLDGDDGPIWLAGDQLANETDRTAAVIRAAIDAYDMRDSVHDADFLTYLWAAVERYQADRHTAPVPVGRHQGSDGQWYVRPEQG